MTTRLVASAFRPAGPQHCLRAFALALAAFVVPPASFLLAQGGSLTPPGTPAPTMKTLDQLEPRVDIVTLAGDASSEHIISQPGSYYLTANVATAKTNAITVVGSVSGVTIDLNGFEVSRSSGAIGNGVGFGGDRVTVRNGSITGFALGVNGMGSATLGKGALIEQISISACTTYGIAINDSGAVVRDCRVHDNTGGNGIQAGPAATISHCTVSDCLGAVGILGLFVTTISHCTVKTHAGTAGIAVQSGGIITECAVYDSILSTAAIRGETGATISRCTAYNNDTVGGITASQGSTISHCSARSNTNSAASSYGIGTGGHGCTVIDCTSAENTSTNGTLTGTTGAGFNISQGCRVTRCNARSNTGDGIRFSSDCMIKDNMCGSNGIGAGNGAGLFTNAGGSRIDENNASANDRGIDVDGTNNFIVRNTAVGNAVEYDIVANNKVGTIVAAPNSVAISGATGGAGVGSTDPWANFSY